MNIKEKLIRDLEKMMVEKQISEQEQEKINQLKIAVNTLKIKVASIRETQSKGEKISKDLKIKPSDITSLNIDIIKSVFPNINEEDISNLEHYNKVCRKIFFNPNKEDVLNNLNSICELLLELISAKEELISTLNRQIKPIQEILSTLENNYINISKGDLDQIVEILKVSGKNEIEILEYIRELAIDIEKSIIYSKEETSEIDEEKNELGGEDGEEILEENEEDQESIKQAIIRLLNENEYQELVPYLEERQRPKVEKIKQELFTYGKINNIEAIIKTLKKYNINLAKEVENGNLFKIFNLFLYSSKENIETIFKLALDPDICICKYDKQGNLILDEKGKPQINFTLLLERASRFISRKRRYKRRESSTQIIEIDSEVEGNLGDYIKNIKFFRDLGVDIKGIFKKIEQSSKDKGGYFDTPHDKILRNKMIFDKYGIHKSAYLSKLDCFDSSNPADIIEMFIELDILEYIQSKVSRLHLTVDNPLIYRIVRTYQLAELLPNPDNLPLHQNAKQFLFKNWQGDSFGKYIDGLLDGYIANPEKHVKKGVKLDTGINKQNGAVITKKYIRNEVLTEEQMSNFTRFDEVIINNDNLSTDLIDERSLLIRRINAISKRISNFNNGNPNVLIFGKEPNEFRISKMKFFRIYNTLIKEGFNIENDRDCVLYALTYNSILTKEQFELVKTIVDKTLFDGLDIAIRKNGGRK